MVSGVKVRVLGVISSVVWFCSTARKSLRASLMA